jgi:hypothetical protein
MIYSQDVSPVPSLGVVIPCYNGHIQYITRCLQTMQDSTLHPDVVAISFSSTSSDNIPDLSGFPFKIVTAITSDYKNAAQNRNIGASLVNVDILTFFDADDEMHPQRLQIIHNFFRRYPNYDAFYHNYIYLKGSKETSPYTPLNIDHDWNLLIHVDILQKDPNGIGLMVNPEYAKSHSPFDTAIQFGHVSVTNRLFIQYKFPEDKNLARQEDSVYAANIVRKNYKIGHCPHRLSKYN